MKEIYNHPPPIIITNFDKNLLSFPILGTLEYYEYYLKKIIKLAEKKIRNQDVGKRREFDKLLEEYKEVYERKKIQEKELKEKNRDQKERSYLSNSGKTIRFKRLAEK